MNAKSQQFKCLQIFFFWLQVECREYYFIRILHKILSMIKILFLEIDQLVPEKEFGNMRKKAASLAWTDYGVNSKEHLERENMYIELVNFSETILWIKMSDVEGTENTPPTEEINEALDVATPE